MPSTPVTVTAAELQLLRDAERELKAILAEREAIKGELRVMTVQRDLLLEQLKAFQRKLFAAKSEARGSEQKDLFLNEAEALAAAAQPAQEEEGTPETEVAGHKRKKRGRKPLHPALPRVEVRHELPESERVSPLDGQTLVEIGVEVSEQLDIVPQQVRVIQHQRVKYACPCCDGGIKTTPAPARIIPKGLLTESALAWCITSKYQDGLPLYRQAALLHRFGGDLSRGTLAASIVRVGQAVQPVVNLLRDHLLEADVVYGDETTVQVLKEPGRPAQRKSFLWAQMNGTGPPVRLFAYSPTRETKQATALYAGIKPGAVLMTDGYAPYDDVSNTYQLVHLGCWAHARRYLVEAEQALPKDKRPDHPVTGSLQRIGKLFAIESHTLKMKPEQRQQVRAEQSQPLLAEIETMLLQHLHTVLPQSLFGKALHYLHGQWPKLVRYIENGTWPISNNPCENAIRPFVIGRRNFLFCDTVAGANASASLYSLVETCKANDVDSYQYLVALFKALPHAQTADDYEALLPWRLKPSTVFGYRRRPEGTPLKDRLQKKGIVESGVKYVKNSFGPLRDFRDLADANRQVRAWVMAEAGTRIHGTPGWSRSVRAGLLLGAVPSGRQVVWLKATATMVHLYEEYILLATHLRQGALGARSPVTDHLPPEAQAWQLHDVQWCLREAKRIGPSCSALVRVLFGDRVLIKLRAVQGLLRFAQQCSDERLEAACRRANHFGTPNYGAVKQILAKGAGSRTSAHGQHAGHHLRPRRPLLPRHPDAASSLNPMNPIPELSSALKQLRLSGVLDTLEVRNREAVERQLAHTDFLALLVHYELARRDQKKLSQRVRRASFRGEKTLEGFDFDRLPNLNRATVYDLATGRYIEEKACILIAGPCGTGKSHLAQALGHAAVRAILETPFEPDPGDSAWLHYAEDARFLYAGDRQRLTAGP